MSFFDGVNEAEIIPATSSIVVAMAKDPALYQSLLSRFPTQVLRPAINSKNLPALFQVGREVLSQAIKGQLQP